MDKLFLDIAHRICVWNFAEFFSGNYEVGEQN